MLSALQVALPCATGLQWQPVAQLHHLHSQQTTQRHQTATFAIGASNTDSHVLQPVEQSAEFSVSEQVAYVRTNISSSCS